MANASKPKIFISSNAGAIRLGSNWLAAITEQLRNYQAMLVFCSPYSVIQPWINFECGAAWARGIELAPLCHSGLRPVDLPVPLSLLQGIEVSDKTKIDRIFRLIARKLNSKVPSFDAQSISQQVKAFEGRYVERTEVTSHLTRIRSISSLMFNLFSELPADQVTPVQGVPEQLVVQLRPHLEAL
jgi:hypothetical protein